MRKLTKLLCAAALFGMAQDAARAEDHACKFAEWGYSYYRIEQRGETWTYLLTASGPNWRTIPYGYHAPGSLVSAGKDGTASTISVIRLSCDQLPLRSALNCERNGSATHTFDL